MARLEVGAWVCCCGFRHWEAYLKFSVGGIYCLWVLVGGMYCLWVLVGGMYCLWVRSKKSNPRRDSIKSSKTRIVCGLVQEKKNKKPTLSSQTLQKVSVEISIFHKPTSNFETKCHLLVGLDRKKSKNPTRFDEKV